MSMQQQIYNWVQGFEPWKRDLSLRAAASADLSEVEVQEVTAMLLADDGAPEPREVKLEDLPGASDGHLPMTVDKVSGLNNVNAISDDQVLGFSADKVNVIYGSNGSGKTGYCRILKHAGRSLRSETVLTNVEAKRNDPPAATVSVTIGTESKDVPLDLSEAPAALLGRLCCVDSQAGEIYLTKATEVDYAPTSLMSVSRLADGLRKIEAELTHRADLAQPSALDLGVYGSTKVAEFLGDLSEETTDEQIDALAHLSEKEQTQRDLLRKQSGEIDAQNAPKLRQAAELAAGEVQSLEDGLKELQKQLDSEAIEALGKARGKLKNYIDAANLAAKAFKSEPLEEVGSDEWRVLWDAARGFAAHQQQAFPSDHDAARCPLCQQELDAEARDRLSRFDIFVKENIDTKLEEARRAEQALLAQFPDIETVRLTHNAAISRLPGDAGQAGAKVAAYLDQAQRLVKKLREGKLDGVNPLSAPPGEVNVFVQEKTTEAKEHGELELAEDQRKIKEELAELDARHKLSTQRDEVIRHRNQLLDVSRLEKAKKATGTNAVSRRITSLSETLIKADLQGALNRQLDALGFDGLKVVAVPQTKAGEPMVKLRFKTIDGIPLTDVLSQGEQRRLALAMFLAEMEVLPGGNPVLLDDPTSSIDQEGRKSIARTLAKLADSRQVIIFTHEMSFVYEIQRKTKDNLKLQHLLRIGKTTGHVQESLPWEGLSPKKRIPMLEAELNALAKTNDEGHPEEYARQVITFCARMRQAFERTVEERVLAGVVTRREDDVHTKKLRQVRLSGKVCDLVDEGMDENSPWLHDKAVADGSAPPTISELQQGIDIYKALQKELAAMETAQHKKVELKPAEPAKAQPDQGALALELVSGLDLGSSDASPTPKSD